VNDEREAEQHDERDVATPPRGTPVPAPPAAAPPHPTADSPVPPPTTADPLRPQPPVAVPRDAAREDAVPAAPAARTSDAPRTDTQPSGSARTDAPPSDPTPIDGGQQVATPATLGQPTPPSSVAGPDPARRRRAFYVVALVVGLVSTAWFSTEYLRESWLQLQPHEAVTVGADGFAAHDGLQVRLVEATDLGGDPGLPGSDWAPPAGFHAWRVVLETVSTNADLTSSCDVVLVDAEGRQFQATQFVENFADGYEYSYTCSPLPPDTDLGPEQAVLALVPADAEIRTVEVTSRDLWPVFLQLPID